ncbi:MAG: MarR family transcriptional regulator [Robiginitomaculum sp.]|nr:MAG: MarR family transcriptional regulator [Robiginitomaculum sp.]
MMLAQKLPTSGENADQGMKQGYLRTLMLVERLHRQLLDVVKDELDRERRDDINSVQALLLFNIGEDELTAGELRTRGHYLGSNVSYNLKKLVDGGYLSHQRSAKDKRAVRVRLTEEGIKVCSMVSALFDRQLISLGPVANLGGDELTSLNGALMRLERFWTDHIRYRL